MEMIEEVKQEIPKVWIKSEHLNSGNSIVFNIHSFQFNAPGPAFIIPSNTQNIYLD